MEIYENCILIVDSRAFYCFYLAYFSACRKIAGPAAVLNAAQSFRAETRDALIWVKRFL